MSNVYIEMFLGQYSNEGALKPWCMIIYPALYDHIYLRISVKHKKQL